LLSNARSKLAVVSNLISSDWMVPRSFIPEVEKAGITPVGRRSKFVGRYCREAVRFPQDANGIPSRESIAKLVSRSA
jgi:hypothetical protein